MMGDMIAIGRNFRPEESEPGGERVTVLSHGFWQRQLAGRREAVGRQILLDGLPHTIVGVAKEDFFFPRRNTALYTPIVLERGVSPRSERTLFVMARLNEGVSADEASAEIEGIAARLTDEYPDTNEDWSARAVGLRDDLVDGAALAMMLLYGSITFVLLIACANVANLLLSRATVREKEIALRTAMGAGRLRIIRQLLTESVILSFVGGVLGLVIGIWGMQVLKNMLAPDPNVGFIAEEMNLSLAILGHTIAVSGIAGLLFGLAPALQTSRPNLSETLKEGGRGGSGGVPRRFLRNGLVVAEVALALALLGTSGAFIRAFLHIYTADPGFDPKGLLTMRIALPEAEYGGDDQTVRFYRAVLERLEAIPGVESAAATTTLPLTAFQRTGTARATIEGFYDEQELDNPNVVDLVVSPGYFETMRIPILQGRGVSDQDNEEAPLAAVVSQEMVRRYWSGTDPLGKRFKLGNRSSDAPWVSVVGVAADVQTSAHSLREPTPPIPHVFLPHAQHPRRETSIAIRTALEPTAIGAAARQEVWDVDPNQPADNVKTMETVIAEVDTQNTFFVRILTGLSTVALLLAGVGIYGVISYAVNQRSKEIGIRMAMGAQPRSILYLVIKQGALLTVAGLALGIAGAVFFVRLLGSQLEGIQVTNASSVSTYVAVSVVLLAVAKLASFLPARRAVKVDPLVTLRYE